MPCRQPEQQGDMDRALTIRVPKTMLTPARLLPLYLTAFMLMPWLSRSAAKPERS